MSSYFDETSNRVPFASLAQSAHVNNLRDDVGAAFDLLPPATTFDKMTMWVTDTGAANAYAVAMPNTITSYVAGVSVRFQPANANTGASTLNIDTIGPVSIKRPDGSNLEAGDIVTTQIIELTYDGTNFVFTGAWPAGYYDDVIAAAAAAALSETNAGTSETNAATSETNAATSETNAATSETNAATSETNAEAAWDAFNARYLGSKASDPTLDNDGNPLIDGATYWNTTSNRLRVYDLGNTTWIENIIASTDITFANLDANGDVGTGAAQVAAGNHNHTGTYLPIQTIGIADGNLVEIDGVVASGEYVKFTANGLDGRTAAQLKAELNLVIGTDVQGYDAGLAYLDGLNFTNESTFKSAVNLEPGTDVQVFDSATMKSDEATNMSRALGCTVHSLGSAASITPDFSYENVKTWTVTGATTINNPTNNRAGVFNIIATINATGGYGMPTWGSNYTVVSGVWYDAANSVNILSMLSDGTNVYVWITQA